MFNERNVQLTVKREGHQEGGGSGTATVSKSGLCMFNERNVQLTVKREGPIRRGGSGTATVSMSGLSMYVR